MLSVKVPLKDAEKVKRFIIENSLFDERYRVKKEKDHIYFPIIEKEKIIKSFPDIKFSKTTLDELEKVQNAREKLKKKLSEEEYEKLKTAYDAIGDIAIIEVDDKLKERDKLIAQAILSSNKGIKTVVKKAGIHSGEFRTQDVEYVLGEKKTEALYKENGIRLKLDVGKVYFSPRLGTERKRIAGLVKKGENILVMFSGCAPYPVVLSKNTDANHIIGIELNPIGHKYGLMNVKLNKLKNVTLFNADVNQFVPKFKNIEIGLKSHWNKEQLKRRLERKFEIIEFHLNPEDLDSNMKEIEEAIRSLKGNKIYVHAPFRYKGYEMTLSSTDKKVLDNSIELFMKLEKLCEKHGLEGFIAHPQTDEYSELKKKYGIEYEHTQEVLERTLSVNKFKRMLIENTPFGFFSNAEIIENIALKYNVKICLDMAHLFVTSKNEEEYYSSIERISKLDPYFHIADTNLTFGKFMKEHTCEIGKGKVDFWRVLPLIRKGVVEITNKDEFNPHETINTYDSLNKMINVLGGFDRILMPLPKSAEEFLDSALCVSKKGTVIHFYDFLHEDKFDDAIKKIDIACKRNKMKYKVLSVNKCGQHAPHIYRICVDFEIV